MDTVASHLGLYHTVCLCFTRGLVWVKATLFDTTESSQSKKSSLKKSMLVYCAIYILYTFSLHKVSSKGGYPVTLLPPSEKIRPESWPGNYMYKATPIWQLSLSHHCNEMSHLVEKPTMWFPNRSDINRPVQLQKQARILKFRI